MAQGGKKKTESPTSPKARPRLPQAQAENGKDETKEPKKGIYNVYPRKP